MAEGERRFSKARLEAFSDGVIAVVIAIMALELKAPEDAEPEALLRLWPSFAVYRVSFGFVADLRAEGAKLRADRAAR